MALKDLNNKWDHLQNSYYWDKLNRRFFKLNMQNDRAFNLYSVLIMTTDTEDNLNTYHRAKISDPFDGTPKLFKKIIK